MPSIDTSEAPAIVSSSTLHSTIIEAGRQRQGQLWSNLKVVCNLLQVLSPVTVNTNQILFQHLQFKAGQRVHSIGQPFDTLYIVNSGFLKTVLIDELGDEQVLSFPMKSDIVGIDGVHTRHYVSECTALSDCDLILMPFKKLTELGRAHIELENVMYGVMSRELVREQAMIGLLGSLSAEARVARFLVSLGDRFANIGYSNKTFNLRMTRQDIGSYLGLTLETVSRTLSAFNHVGLITVDQRAIGIKDAETLKTLRRLPPSGLRRKQNSRAMQKAQLNDRGEGARFNTAR